MQPPSGRDYNIGIMQSIPKLLSLMGIALSLLAGSRAAALERAGNRRIDPPAKVKAVSLRHLTPARGISLLKTSPLSLPQAAIQADSKSSGSVSQKSDKTSAADEMGRKAQAVNAALDAAGDISNSGGEHAHGVAGKLDSILRGDGAPRTVPSVEMTDKAIVRQLGDSILWLAEAKGADTAATPQQVVAILKKAATRFPAKGFGLKGRNATAARSLLKIIVRVHEFSARKAGGDKALFLSLATPVVSEIAAAVGKADSSSQALAAASEIAKRYEGGSRAAKLSKDDIRAAAMGVIASKGMPWSETEYNLAHYEALQRLRERGATPSQIKLFLKLCAEAPIRGGAFNPYSGD